MIMMIPSLKNTMKTKLTVGFQVVLGSAVFLVAQEAPPPEEPDVPEDDPAFLEVLEDADPGLLEQLADILGEGEELVIDEGFPEGVQELLVAPGVLRFQGQVNELSSGQVKTDADAEMLLERAEAFAEQGRYDLASRLWQEAIDQSSDALIERPEWRDRTFQGHTYYQLRPMIEEIETSMARTIKGGLEAYQLKIDGDARVLLARSSLETRESALAEVILRYFLSSIGDEAAFELGCLKMERGEFLPAVRLFTKILEEYPQPSVDRVQVQIRLAGSLARSGNARQALEIVEALYEAHPEHRRILALVRQDIEAVDERRGEDSLADSVLTTPAGVQTSLARSRLPERLQTVWTQHFDLRLPPDWPVLPESPRDALPKIRDPYQNARRTAPAPEPPALIDRWQELFMPVGQILVREGRLFFKTDDRLVACDSATGNLQWLGFRNSLVLDEHTQTGAARNLRARSASTAPYPSTPEEYLLFGDMVNQSMTLAGDTIYVLQGDPLDFKDETEAAAPEVPNIRIQRGRIAGRANVPGRFRANRLVAYDAGSGKLQWYRTADEASDPDLPHLPIKGRAGFSRAPLPYGSLLLVPVHEESSLWLTGLDRETGETLWRTFLCDEPAGETQGLSVVSLSVAAGEAYVGSGAGLLFSVDAISGKLNWAVRYPRKVKDEVVTAANTQVFRAAGYLELPQALDGWDQDRLLAHGNEIMVASTDFDQLFSLNRRTANLAWEAPRQPFRSEDPSNYILAAHGGLVYAAGAHTVRCYQARGGKMVWETVLPEESFARGALTPEAVYVPLKDSIVQLDPLTGELAARAQVTPPSANEPVGNLFTDGERLIVFGLKKVYALAPPESDGGLN